MAFSIRMNEEKKLLQKAMQSFMQCLWERLSKRLYLNALKRNMISVLPMKPFRSIRMMAVSPDPLRNFGRNLIDELPCRNKSPI